MGGDTEDSLGELHCDGVAVGHYVRAVHLDDRHVNYVGNQLYQILNCTVQSNNEANAFVKDDSLDVIEFEEAQEAIADETVEVGALVAAAHYVEVAEYKAPIVPVVHHSGRPPDLVHHEDVHMCHQRYMCTKTKTKNCVSKEHL